jgi:cytochrome c oxidase assembly factor CtaG
LTAWSFEPLTIAILVITAELYLFAYSRVPAFPRKRLAYFFLGTFSLVIALLSPVGTYDTVLFWVHMVQHMILIFVAAPLLCLSSPLALALRSLPPRGRRRLSRILNSPPFRGLTHPVFTWVFFQTVMWGTHFSPLYESTLTSSVEHAAEHALYLFAAYLFWRPVVGLDPGPRHPGYPVRFLYVMVAMAPMAFLGLAVYSAGHVLYPYYRAIRTSPGYSWLPSALSDQRLAGEIMWVIGFFMFIIVIVFLLFAWIRHERHEQERVDRRLDGPARREIKGATPSTDPRGS